MPVLEKIIAEQGTPAPAVSHETAPSTDWTPWQRFLFRVALIFFLSPIIPLKWDWYQGITSINSLSSFFSHITMRYRVDFFSLPGESGKWGIASFASWGAVFAVALVVASVWTWLARKSPRKNYDVLYFWLRVLVRYWTGFAILAYGYMKLFPGQMPYPSLANLNTQFGDYTGYKLYWHSVGIVTWYQVVLGIVEVSAGLLLFFRRTVAIGAVLNAGVLFNVTYANFAYDGGVHVHSASISFFSLFLLTYYGPDLWRLLIKREDVTPNHYYPDLSATWKRRVFYSAKYAALFISVIVYAYVRYDGYFHGDSSKKPREPGLAGARGFYNVTEFKLDGKTIPYSPIDKVRWLDVVLENYSTLSYRVGHPVSIALSNGAPAPKDLDKTYEFAGVGGGRKYFYYQIDEKKQELVLQDKNRDPDGKKKRRDGVPEPAKPGETTKLAWHYSRPSDTRILLSGLDDNQHAIEVVLDRIDKNYAVQLSQIENQP